MSGRFWHLACVNPKTGRVSKLSETDADHLQAFWTSNTDPIIKQEPGIKQEKPQAQSSKWSFTPQTTPNNFNGSLQEYQQQWLGELRQRYNNQQRNTANGPENPINVEASAFDENFKTTYETTFETRPAPSKVFGAGPAPTPQTPHVLRVYSSLWQYKIDGPNNRTYVGMLLQKGNRWLTLVPRKGGLKENNACNHYSTRVKLGSKEWWRLAFCGYETERERTNRTSLRDICL